jgi:hypothetical protein
VLEGPPGSGKTRLARWIASRAHERVGAAVYAPTEVREAGFARSFVAAWARTEGLDPAEAAEEVGWRSSDVWRGGLGVEALVALAGGGRLPPLEQRIGTLCSLIERLARERLVVLLLEDARRAPGASRIAADLVRRVRAPLLVLLCMRPGEGQAADAQSTSALLDMEHVHHIVLDPVPDEDIARLLEHGLYLQPATAGWVASRARGNAGFAVGLVRHWIATESLRGHADGFVLEPGADRHLPHSLGATWRARLDALREALGQAGALALERAAFLGPTAPQSRRARTPARARTGACGLPRAHGVRCGVGAGHAKSAAHGPP